MQQPPQSPASIQPRLETATQDALRRLDVLETALHDETQALSSGDSTALLAALDGKRRALHDLEQVLERSGLGELLGQLNTGAACCPGPPSWPLLVGRLQRCRRLNEATGAAIASALQGTRRLLELLGHPVAPPSYRATGHADPVAAPRHLALC